MNLVIFEDDQTDHFTPLHWLHAVFELRCGATALFEKIERAAGQQASALIVRPELTDIVAERVNPAINNLSKLAGEDTLFVNGRFRGGEFTKLAPGQACWRQDVLACWRANSPVSNIARYADIAVAANRANRVDFRGEWFDYIWDLVIHNAAELTADFVEAGRSGVYGTMHPSAVVYGSTDRLLVRDGANVHPFVCIDTREGPVTIDAGAEIHPFTRIEGPCYIGSGTILLGAKVREGCSIGSMCRIGGEVEESIVHGYSNKYHDGFLGHAYVGEWVNLGALTTNSDLKNDYSNVSIILNGKPVDTGSNKVGSFIGDHVKTSIGTLLNTGSVIGPMAILVTHGAPMPKAIPAFAWHMGGAVTKGFGLNPLIDTARHAMSRRKKELSAAQEARLRQVYECTAADRDRQVNKTRQAMLSAAR